MITLRILLLPLLCVLCLGCNGNSLAKARTTQTAVPSTASVTDITTVTAPHPRVWLTPARLAFVKAQYAVNSPRWQAVKAIADQAVAHTGQGKNDPVGCLPAVALAYLCTHNPAYLNNAISALGAACVSSNDLRANSHFNYRTVLADVSAAYDWLYPELVNAPNANTTDYPKATTLAQQVATWLMDRCDEVWPDTNPAQALGWATTDPFNNYFWGYMATWAASLATFGDGTDTGVGAVSGINRPAYHLALALKKFRTIAQPALAGWGKGGLFAEGTNYDATWNMVQWIDAQYTATGEDIVNEPDFGFLHDSLYARIYTTAPDRKSLYVLGDQTRVASAPESDFDRWKALPIIDQTTDSTLAAYGKNWLDSLNPSACTWWFTAPWELIYYNPQAQSSDYTKALPTNHFFPGAGLLLQRSDWTSSATYWGIWAGLLQEGHQFYDNGGFLIWKGGWLAGNESMWTTQGNSPASWSNNNIAFGGQKYGQTQAWEGWQKSPAKFPAAEGSIVKNEVAPEYTYFEGQYWPSYVQDRSHGGIQIASDVARKFVWISPNTFLLYDRATLLPAYQTLTKDWYLHSQNAYAIAGNTYTFNDGAYQGTGQVLLPSTGVTLADEPVTSYNSATVACHRLHESIDTGNATDFFLNAIQITPTGQSPTPAALVNVSSGNMDGANVGGWVVLFGHADLVTEPVTYSVQSATFTTHLLLDLAPSTSYTASFAPAGSGAATIVKATSTAAGSLMLSAPAGNYTVTVTREQPPARSKTASLSPRPR